jgi:predicted alpha/beta-fold hydrolase
MNDRPSLIVPRELDFTPPRTIRSPHLQSVLASSNLRRPLVRARSAPMLEASRPRIVHCPDGTRLEALVSLQRSGRSRGLVVAIHGWHGCADSLYLLSTTGRLFDAGFDIVRLHLRDHGGTHGLNEELFHSCRIDEAVAAVAELQHMFPDRSMGLLGFSLGGNFALRIARRAPEAGIDLSQVVAVCPVLEPGRTMDALDAGWFGYRMTFMRNWRKSMLAKQAAFPERYDFTATRDIDTLAEMTDWFVERHTPYPDSEAYLQGYTLTGDALAGLTVPSLVLSALDDPVIPADGLQRLAPSPALDVAVTRHGGHCGYVADGRLRCWLDEVLLEQFAGGQGARSNAASVRG